MDMVNPAVSRSARHEHDLKTLVRRDRNHPSVLMWSIGNEIDYPNDPYCHPSFTTMTGNNDANKPAAERMYNPAKPNMERLAVLAAMLADEVKQEDPTRPVTAAAAFPELSSYLGFLDSLDVVGYNYKEQFYEEDHKRFPEKPFFGSENGHTMEAWKAVRDSENIFGQCLWTGIDFFGETVLWPMHGSSAGLLTTAGFEKPQYYYRLGLWLETPAVALVTARRSDARSQGVTVGTKIPQQNKKRRFPGWVQPGKASFLRKQPICFQFHGMQQLGRIDLLAVEITARADVQIIPPCKVKVIPHHVGSVLRVIAFQRVQPGLLLQAADQFFQPLRFIVQLTRVRQHSLAAGRMDDGNARHSIRFVPLNALVLAGVEVAVEGFARGGYKAMAQKYLREMRTRDHAAFCQLLHLRKRNSHAFFFEEGRDAVFALVPAVFQLLTQRLHLRAVLPQAKAHNVQMPVLAGSQFNPAQDGDSRFFSGLHGFGESVHSVVVGEGQTLDPRLPRQAHQLRRAVLPIRRRAVRMQIALLKHDQISPFSFTATTRMTGGSSFP